MDELNHDFSFDPKRNEEEEERDESEDDQEYTLYEGMDKLLEEANEELEEEDEHIYAQEDDDESEPSLNGSEDPCYVFEEPKLQDGEIPLGKVVGHESQKKEILSVIDWFNHSKELRAKGVSIPRGVIFYGQPGCGKSLLIKEIIRCCNCPVFVFQGERSNVVEGIVMTFKKARDAKHAIVVFDELDLLINKERRVIRALQEGMDGVESDVDILVLAATNGLSDIPDPLLRHGRLDKRIHILMPRGEEALELLKRHFEEFHLALPEDFEDDEVALALSGINFASIKAVVNDLVLRNGFENITTEMIDESINNITDRDIEPILEDNIEVAVHEAGHAIMAKAFPQFFIVNRLHLSGATGEFRAKEVEEDFWPYDKVIADIKISMAGLIAQKLFFGRGSRGCEEDLQRARSEAYNLINISGYSSCWETLPVPLLRPNCRHETPLKRRRMEVKIEKLLRRCEKETWRYIKAHRAEIDTLGKLLYEKKHLKSKEILACIG